MAHTPCVSEALKKSSGLTSSSAKQQCMSSGVQPYMLTEQLAHKQSVAVEVPAHSNDPFPAGLGCPPPVARLQMGSPAPGPLRRVPRRGPERAPRAGLQPPAPPPPRPGSGTCFAFSPR